MAKLRQDFELTYPLKQKSICGNRLITHHTGDLTVTGTAYCDDSTNYSVDIDFVKWNGTDIKPVLGVTGGLEEIEESCLRQAAKLFAGKEVVA